MPAIDPSFYQHPLDKKLLESLQSIPGFKQVLKAFLKVFAERRFFIENNSSNIRLGPKQLPEIYNLLPPVAERLGIQTPSLFLTNDRSVNAQTSGENEPFICLHAGALETLSMPEVQAVLAHECGHIACHHVMYHMMGTLVLSGALAVLPGVGALVSTGLQYAFMEWMRASEYSADRAAALAMGGSEETISLITSLAGAYSSLNLEINDEEFLNQATEYEQAMQASSVNKAFEVLSYSLSLDHPLNAYRALELTRWCNTQEFADMNNFLEQQDTAASGKSSFEPSLPSDNAPGSAEPEPRDQQDSIRPRFCTKCGSPATGGKFCEACGNPLG